LAADLPALWSAATTSRADRRAAIRQLVERVEAARRGSSEAIDVTVFWRGGLESRHVAYQGTHGYIQLENYQQLRARVTALRGEGLTSGQIAESLNRERFRPSRGSEFKAGQVRRLLVRFGLAEAPAGIAGPKDLPGRGEWWLPGLARELGVRPIAVHQWRWAGWIHARQLPGDNGRVIVWADRDELRRLRRLGKYQTLHRFQRCQAIPPELTEPKPRPKRAGAGSAGDVPNDQSGK
jgi:hypothetical protein